MTSANNKPAIHNTQPTLKQSHHAVSYDARHLSGLKLGATQSQVCE